MTQEEKAKAYDEAVKRAKAAIDMAADKDLVGGVVRTIFPELAESEDEKIRKLLVWQVHRNIEDETNDLAQSVYDGIKGHDPDIEESIEDWKRCLAWLEKQKEQKPEEKSEKPIIPEWSEEALNVMNLVYRCIRKVLAEFAVYTENEELLESREETVCYYSQRCAEKILKSLRPQYHGDVTMTEAYKMGLEAGKLSSWKPSENELAKKYLEGYTKGRNDALRKMSDFVGSHFNTQSGTSTKSGGNE